MDELPPLEGMADNSDPSITINMRGWLETALRNAGAKITGKGFGCSMADLDIVVEGCKFNVEIRPRP